MTAYLKTVRDHRHILLLILIIGSGALIRTYGVGDRPLWEDESHYTMIAEQVGDAGTVLPRNPFFGPALDGHPPLSLYAFSIPFLGDNMPGPAQIRIFSVLFGILTIPAVFLLGSALYDIPTGLIGAGLMAVSTNHIAFSRLIHPAAAGLFFFSVAIVLFIHSLKQRDTTTLAASILFSVFALLTHYAAFVLLPLFSILLLQYSAVPDLTRRWRAWTLALAGLAGYILIQIAAYLSFIVLPFQTVGNNVMMYNAQVFSVDASQSVILVGAEFVGRFFTEIVAVSGQQAIQTATTLLGQYLSPHILYLPGVFMVAALVGLAGQTRITEDGRRGTLFLVVWILVVLVFAAGPVSFFMGQTGRTPFRIHPFLSIAILLLTARGIRLLGRVNRGWWIAATILFGLYLMQVPTGVSPPPWAVDRPLDPGTERVKWNDLDRYRTAADELTTTGTAGHTPRTQSADTADNRGAGPP